MSMNDTQLTNWMKLTRVKGLGPRKLISLFQVFGSLDRIIDATPSELFQTRKFNERMLSDWQRLKYVSDENFLKSIKECNDKGIKIVTLFDKEYPDTLKNVPYPPFTLFFMGEPSLLKYKKIAIVGTRHPEENAKTLAFDFAKNLADQGLIIISGGAEGIDTKAHEGALASECGKTICVLGTGFSKPFPKQNIPLFNKITERGGLLISEHLPNFPGTRISMIQRNRITSGLSKAVLVCASRLNGGSMVQTKIAYDQRIPIFCPNRSLNIKPNEGIVIAIEKFGAKEVMTPAELSQKLKNNPQVSLDNW